MREVRQLASTIVMDATALHDGLQREVDNKVGLKMSGFINLLMRVCTYYVKGGAWMELPGSLVSVNKIKSML